jgi:hypothetical protein
MKELLLPVILCTSTLLFAQSKNEHSIAKFLYVKVSPTLLTAGGTERLLPENSLTPAIFGTVGAKIRYAALGFSAGYFSLKSAGPITPLGVDLTITDFKRKKAFPVITVQWHRVHFTEEYTKGRGGFYSCHISGNEMHGISGGVAFRALKTTKILVTLGFARMNSKTIISIRNPFPPQGDPNTPSITNTKDHHNMLVLAASFVL